MHRTGCLGSHCSERVVPVQSVEQLGAHVGEEPHASDHVSYLCRDKPDAGIRCSKVNMTEWREASAGLFLGLLPQDRVLPRHEHGGGDLARLGVDSLNLRAPANKQSRVSLSFSPELP